MQQESSNRKLPEGELRELGAWDVGAFTAHLRRLGKDGLRDRFNGTVEEDYVTRYAMKCLRDKSVMVTGYVCGETVLGAAELHLFGRGGGAELAFSVDESVRGLGLGGKLFVRIVRAAVVVGCRFLEVTTHADNRAMSALARKHGTRLAFSHGEATGKIDLAAG